MKRRPTPSTASACAWPATAAWSGAIVRRSPSEGCEVLTATRGEVDLRRQADVEAGWRHAAAVVFVAAAKVGGILANHTLSGRVPLRQPDDRGERHPRGARDRRREAAVPRLVLHLPEARAAADPRGALLTGPLEPTNEWYAIAKIAGIKLCQAYRRAVRRRLHLAPCRPISTARATIST